MTNAPFFVPTSTRIRLMCDSPSRSAERTDRHVGRSSRPGHGKTYVRGMTNEGRSEGQARHDSAKPGVECKADRPRRREIVRRRLNTEHTEKGRTGQKARSLTSLSSSLCSLCALCPLCKVFHPTLPAA